MEDYAQSEWWRSFHVIEMADLFLDRPQAQVNATVQFLTKFLQLKPGDHVLDQCCGVGTVALEFAQQGFVATGVDLCQKYIDRAIESSQAKGLDCEFQCADGFKFVPSRECDGVFNWYSSFGYASTDSQNQEMLARAFDSLKSGCHYALDVPNFPSLIRGFQHHLVRSGTSRGKPVTCVRESQLDLRKGLLKQNWQWLVEGQNIDQRQSALRIYLPHQIVEMLSNVGFEEIQMFGNTKGDALTIDSERLILVARKPRS